LSDFNYFQEFAGSVVFIIAFTVTLQFG